MTLFPEFLFTAMVYVAVVVTAAGSIGLVAMLIRDWKRGSLW